MKTIFKLPLLVILMGIGAIAMVFPAMHAARLGDLHTAQTFGQFSLLSLVVAVMIGVATVNYAPRHSARTYLMALFGALILLPVMLALPLLTLMPSMTFWDGYFEMVSSLTTTGATIFDDPKRLSDPLHFWRALVGWMGGFLMWVCAIAVLAPLNLGGFEVNAKFHSVGQGAGTTRIKVADASARLQKYARQLAPIYLAITLVLAIGLMLLGERFFVATLHAMSTISTSAISPVSGLGDAQTGVAGEVLIFLFLMFAVSRITFASDMGAVTLRQVFNDREFRLMLICITVLPALLFLRHWFGAFEVADHDDVFAGLHALWGSVFTVLSFLTTTGFESADWQAARDWSGLRTPGLVLIGLATMGGGVATTAGGVKLLRIYALYKHGLREMQKLSFPSSVGGSGTTARRIRREGAYIAWIFFMLFALSVAGVMLLLSLTGIGFEASLSFAISALSTTGPIASVAGETPLSYAALNAPAKVILCAAMVLGRLETLAIIALLNPIYWRQ